MKKITIVVVIYVMSYSSPVQSQGGNGHQPTYSYDSSDSDDDTPDQFVQSNNRQSVSTESLNSMHSIGDLDEDTLDLIEKLNPDSNTINSVSKPEKYNAQVLPHSSDNHPQEIIRTDNLPPSGNTSNSSIFGSDVEQPKNDSVLMETTINDRQPHVPKLSPDRPQPKNSSPVLVGFSFNVPTLNSKSRQNPQNVKSNYKASKLEVALPPKKVVNSTSSPVTPTSREKMRIISDPSFVQELNQKYKQAGPKSDHHIFKLNNLHDLCDDIVNYKSNYYPGEIQELEKGTKKPIPIKISLCEFFDDTLLKTSFDEIPEVECATGYKIREMAALDCKLYDSISLLNNLSFRIFVTAPPALKDEREDIENQLVTLICHVKNLTPVCLADAEAYVYDFKTHYIAPAQSFSETQNANVNATASITTSRKRTERSANANVDATDSITTNTKRVKRSATVKDLLQRTSSMGVDKSPIVPNTEETPLNKSPQESNTEQTPHNKSPQESNTEQTLHNEPPQESNTKQIPHNESPQNSITGEVVSHMTIDNPDQPSTIEKTPTSSNNSLEKSDGEKTIAELLKESKRKTLARRRTLSAKKSTVESNTETLPPEEKSLRTRMPTQRDETARLSRKRGRTSSESTSKNTAYDGIIVTPGKSESDDVTALQDTTQRKRPRTAPTEYVYNQNYPERNDVQQQDDSNLSSLSSLGLQQNDPSNFPSPSKPNDLNTLV